MLLGMSGADRCTLIMEDPDIPGLCRVSCVCTIMAENVTKRMATIITDMNRFIVRMPLVLVNGGVSRSLSVLQISGYDVEISSKKVVR